ncbi:hypothetical protein ACTI_69750 [Actinoplanes sp. OR16]|uniref:DUF1295 domain-containing protein n=1 Tax=Actinoplanes sp. OR16 TaxID=946334 RepID=UPI000F714472|nr:DUF1295 domain-containing protein [Actinoplanes sp. OR16]BBH70290.1 hypothetical protein ACTI_69750 [Actinoplanes sp. OR16]
MAKRSTGFAVIAGVYAVAGLAGWAVMADTPISLEITFYADIVATIVVFAGSMIVNNASVYDPYWSVAPAVIVIVWAAGDLGAREIAVLVLMLIWAIRLTANWALSWRGLGHEDWRYTRLRSAGTPWWLVNLVGIQLVPTLVVFGGLLPVWPAMTVTGRSFHALDVVAVLVTAGAILIEATADRQLHRFAREPGNRGRIVDRGLWRYSRHPNYLGEILFWWGMWLFGVAAAPDRWWTVIGPVVVVLLFLFVSVPMMDRRSLERRPAYAEYMRRVPALLPAKWIDRGV